MTISWYQNIPQSIDPVAFSIGFVTIHWYSIMWIVAFFIGYILLLFRIKKEEGGYSKDFVQDVVANSLIGALIGGRLGYVIFYDLGYYLSRPLEIISPYNFAQQEWTGIFGMSYHGGLIGVVLAVLWTSHKYQKDFLRLLDFIVPIAPIAYMFGRIGNFLNHELVGRVTSSQFGMFFEGYSGLRHPSQIYEAALEGLVLFVIFWSVRNRPFGKGVLSAWYLIGYAVMRFIVEFSREPDTHLGFIIGNLTMGQILSIIMFIFGVIMLKRMKIKKYFTLQNKV